MAILYEMLPVLLFFLAFKFYDIYVATIIGIIATLTQVLVSRGFHGVWDKKQLITLGIFVVFGGMTLYFHNPIFVKWKPTIVFWVFSLLLIGSQMLTKTPLIQRIMASMVQGKDTIPSFVWKRLNLCWAIFFITLGAVNLYVAYHYNNDVWVNFKFYGITGALFVFSLFQAVYLAKYLPETQK